MGWNCLRVPVETTPAACMGVPGLGSWFLGQCPSANTRLKVTKGKGRSGNAEGCEHLYIDAPGLIHTCVRRGARRSSVSLPGELLCLTFDLRRVISRMPCCPTADLLCVITAKTTQAAYRQMFSKFDSALSVCKPTKSVVICMDGELMDVPSLCSTAEPSERCSTTARPGQLALCGSSGASCSGPGLESAAQLECYTEQ